MFLWILTMIRALPAVACGWALAGGGAIAGESPAAKEHEIKAAFLYNFAKFVEWPPQSFSAATDPIVVGVLGRYVLGDRLERIVKNRQINGRTVMVRRVETPEEIQETHLLFVGAGEVPRFSRMAEAIAARAVLTVGESPAFGQAGGAITFVVEDERLRFDIDLDATQRAGLKLSSQLLKLAKAVKRTR